MIIFIKRAVYFISTILIIGCSASSNENVKTATFKYQEIKNDTLFAYFPDKSLKYKKPILLDTIISDSDTTIEKIPHGICTFHYSNGNVKSVVNYKNGIRDGEAIMYYESGEKYVVENYKKGRLQGDKIKYYTNGHPIIKSYFEDGFHAKNSILFDVNGTKLKDPNLEISIEDLRMKTGMVRVHVKLKNLKKVRKTTYYFTETLSNNQVLHYQLEANKGIGYRDIPVQPNQLYISKLHLVGEFSLRSGVKGGVIKTHNLVVRPLF